MPHCSEEWQKCHVLPEPPMPHVGFLSLESDGAEIDFACLIPSCSVHLVPNVYI
jgi:hypothetical protein